MPEELQQTLGSLHRRPIKYQFQGHKQPSRQIIAVAARLATEAIRESGHMTGDQYNEVSQLILQHHASGAEKVRMLHATSRLCEPLGKTIQPVKDLGCHHLLHCPAAYLQWSWTAHNQLQQLGMQPLLRCWHVLCTHATQRRCGPCY